MMDYVDATEASSQKTVGLEPKVPGLKLPGLEPMTFWIMDATEALSQKMTGLEPKASGLEPKASGLELFGLEPTCDACSEIYLLVCL